MHYFARIAAFVAISALIADAPLLGQRQGGPNPPGRQGGQAGPDAGGRGRPGGAGGAGAAVGAQDGREGRGRGRGPELRTGTSSIRGRVVNATTGSPVRRAQIQASLSNDQGGRGEPGRSTTTDDNGA